MKIDKIIKCKHCHAEQKKPMDKGLTEEMLLWHRCERCNRFGLHFEIKERLTVKEYLLALYGHYRFRYFSKF
jgi:hypothetical protein